MAKPDWGELQQRFLSDHAATGVSPKDWCEAQGLNYATARRYIKKPTAQKPAQKKLRTAQKEKCAEELVDDDGLTKSFLAQLDEATQRATTLEGQLYQEMIGGRFSGSKFIADKVAIPADMLQARFGQSFKVEDGKVVAYDGSGNKIYSRSKPGELAAFDEALEFLVEQYPQKDHILKASGNQGGGSRQSQHSLGQKTMKRDAFTSLSPTDQQSTLKDGITIVD
ncbi:hypothetical protein L2I47_03200 [Klebsiella sp. FK2020ZBJ35]|uniref:DUF6651 domain-containing protein n=1 Tax=Klebsiella sp. FK2020ZBJ35 TaxID=2911174 RepID=UPI001F36764E|nr:DUF6651 domain-containing protein [Klebsiella sp. FK2020ZBJ35]MCF8591207.1 hypothetical protein [Klebsiella sp. FK2020ZBJ35]